MNRGTLLRTAAFAAFAALPALAARVDPNAYEGGSRDDQRAIERRNRSALGAVLGEVRTSMADLMYVKTELYMHNGVAFSSHLNMEAMQSTGEISNREGAEVATTTIPAAERDFRGIVGELERRVKPWQDSEAPHVHTSGTELLPWYRLMTLSDPHNVRAYQIGGWWLKEDKPDEARRFVEEGIAKNPEAFQLRYMRGQLLLNESRASAKGIVPDVAREKELALEAFDEFVRGAEIAARKRPKDYDREAPDTPRSTWTHYNEEDARGTARMAIFLGRDLKPPAEVLKLAERYAAAFGGDALLVREAEKLRRRLAEEAPAVLK